MTMDADKGGDGIVSNHRGMVGRHQNVAPPTSRSLSDPPYEQSDGGVKEVHSTESFHTTAEDLNSTLEEQHGTNGHDQSPNNDGPNERENDSVQPPTETAQMAERFHHRRMVSPSSMTS